MTTEQVSNQNSEIVTTSEDEDENEETDRQVDLATDGCVAGFPANNGLPSYVNVTDSVDVHIGPKLNYNAPVTINQIATYGELHSPHLLLPDSPHYLDALSNTKGEQGVPVFTFKQRLLDRRIVWCATPIIVILGMIFMVALVILFTQQNEKPKNSFDDSMWNRPPPPDPAPPSELTLPDGNKIYSKADWMGSRPRWRRLLVHPTPYVVIAHTVGENCDSLVECGRIFRDYQVNHVSEWDQPDISYNFMIDNAGHVYEGRGWDATNNFQDYATRCNIAIAFTGNYVFQSVTDDQLTALKQLLQLGEDLGKLGPDYKLIAHSQLLPTESPGKSIADAIQNWEHRCTSRCDVGIQCPKAPVLVLGNGTVVDSRVKSVHFNSTTPTSDNTI